MQAVILAGGEGTRLRPLTTTIPKPVVPLANRPFISYTIDWLGRHGIDEVVISCGFLASEVRAVLGEGEERGGGGVRIRYVEEERPLGTAGAVKFAEDILDQRFLVLNGDILADFDLGALQRSHEQSGVLATIALIPVADPSAYGLVRTKGDRVTEFVEKPARDQIDTDLINAGAYVLERKLLEGIVAGEAASFEREVFPGLIRSGLNGVPVSGYWLDIGTPERYLEATFDILEGRLSTALDARLGAERLEVADASEVSSGATVVPPSIVGERCRIENGARVGALVTVGDGCHVCEGAVVERAVLHEDVHLDRHATVLDSILAPGARVGAGSRVDGGSVIGAGAVIREGTVVSGGEIVEPDTDVR